MRGQADLHNHTTCSDGEYTPAALVARARQIRLGALGVTDHDTLEGLAEALAAGAAEKVRVIPGVEVSIRFTDDFFRGSLHLLLYFPARLLDDPAFRAATDGLLAAGRGDILTSARLETINAHFAPGGKEPLLPRQLQEKDLARHGYRFSRRHFALALADLGVRDPRQVNRVLSNESPAYIPSGVPMDTLGDYFRAWPVVRVLAHPAAGSYPGESIYREVLPALEVVERMLPRFLELGLDGLEIYYPGHTGEHMRLLEGLRLLHNLPLATGGSDCHDPAQRRLGSAGVPMAVVEEIERLWRERLG